MGLTSSIIGVTPISPFRELISRVISPVKVVTKTHGPPSRGTNPVWS